MAGFGFTVKGGEELEAAFKAAADDAPRATGSALRTEAELIMGQSKRIVPVETGALRASGHVQPPTVFADGASVTLGYGGAAAPYAVYVHEKLNARHKPPTRAKYLEEPLRAAEIGMAERLAQGIRDWLKRQGR